MTVKAFPQEIQIIPSSFYTGDINSLHAWHLMEENKQAILVDVRTKEEWDLVGVPDVSGLGTKMITLPFRTLPHMEINKNFAAELTSAAPDKTAPLFFICKGGGRSFEAASVMTAEGYENCYNIYDGFEGNPSVVASESIGWKNILPWRAA